MADISKITLPSGSTYDIKDSVAREMISAGVTFIVAWNGTGTPTAASLPAGVVAGGVTGTLAASAAQAGAFYLVKSSTSPTEQTLDIYDEYVVVKPDTSDNTTWFWEKIGDTQLNLADTVTSVTLNKSTDTVIGTDSTFTITQPTIALATGATAGTGVISLTNGVSGKGSSGNSVTALTGLGTPSTSSVLTGVKVTAQPTVALATGATAGDGVISVATGASGTTKYIGGTASGGGAAWNSKDTKTVVTGYAAPTSDTFVKTISPTTSKLTTTSVTGVQSSTTTASKATAATSQTTVSGLTASTSNADLLANCSVSDETLVIGAKKPTTQTTTQFTFADVTVPIKNTSATTVATGAAAANSTGASIVTGVTAGSTADALTGLGTASTASVIGSSATLTNTQPTISMALADASATGKVGVITGVSASTTNIKATASGTTVGANGTASAVTGYPNTTSDTIAVSASNTNVKATASGANTAWNSKDSVTVLTSGSSLTVTKGQ